MDIKIYTSYDSPTNTEKMELVKFLHNHLQEFGDPTKDISKAIEYAVKEIPSPGGFVLKATDQDEIVGAVVVNETGMGGYIPENILVYIAVHEGHRGEGIGKKLMKEAIRISKGDMALHVEENNPAKFLYEKLGFKNKYLEMRLAKNNQT